MISPNTTLINAAINELPILVINAFLTVSFDINVKNSFGDNFSAYAIRMLMESVRSMITLLL